MKDSLKNNSSQLQTLVETWKSNDVTDRFSEIIAIHGDPIGKFRKPSSFFVKRLMDWMGWREDGNNSIFKCPECGKKEARCRKKKEKEHIRLVFKCKTKGCTAEPSPQSVTPMKGSKIPIRFWFLSFYVIGLMEGKIPWRYLDEKRVDFPISKTKKQTIQRRELVCLISKILESYKNRGDRIKYSRMVQLNYPEYNLFKNYKSWYDNTDQWLPWRMFFLRDKCLAGEAATLSGNNTLASEIEHALILKDQPIFDGEWLLRVEVKKGSNDYFEIGDVDWFYVSKIEDISDHDSDRYIGGYRKCAIFLKKDNKAGLTPPFKKGSIFKKALVNSLYLSEKLDIHLNKIVLPSNKSYKILAEKYSE